jgi:hypothetical protein
MVTVWNERTRIQNYKFPMNAVLYRKIVTNTNYYFGQNSVGKILCVCGGGVFGGYLGSNEDL